MTTTTADRSFFGDRAATGRPAMWPLYAVLFSSAAIVVGLIWDISWHRSVGRDTFWSPPHLLEQVAAIVAGLSCGWLVLRTTFSSESPDRASSVRVWGFRGPLGAWVCIWGTAMMITSAPFDNWWHNAYGLDVEIISPPHMILAWGMMAIQIGAMLMAVAAQNRGSATEDKRLRTIYALSASILVLMLTTVIVEDAGYGNEMHRSMFYRMTGLVLPIAMLSTARASRLMWPATTIAAIYMVAQMVLIWVLQLIPATPLLAPIYNPVTHMVPPPFPLLLVVPALLFDIALKRLTRVNDWLLAPLLGAGFVGALLAVNWYWSAFLMSPAARNWFFASGQWDYTTRVGPWQYEYWRPESGMVLLTGLGLAVLTAAISARLGLWLGRAMATVKR